jgi:methionyl-tRNA formyltransferase
MRKKIIFFGSHGISLPLLNFLYHSESVELAGIVSQVDKPAGRGQKLSPTKVSKFANGNGIPLLTPPKPDDATVSWIGSIGCDIILVMAYGHILRENILTIPPLGIYNFHASFLPKYRGAFSIETAIACGESETGVSLMEMVAEMDAGGVTDVERVPIHGSNNCGDVVENIAAACPILLRRNLEKMCTGTLEFTEQNPGSATFTGKLSKKDGFLDFSQPAVVLRDRVRALSPHIGCAIDYGNVLLKIGSTSVEFFSPSAHKPGEVVCANSNGIKIATGDGYLIIYELQKPGGKMLSAGNFISGFSMKPGEIVPSHPFRRLVFDRPPWLLGK